MDSEKESESEQTYQIFCGAAGWHSAFDELIAVTETFSLPERSFVRRIGGDQKLSLTERHASTKHFGWWKSFSRRKFIPGPISTAKEFFRQKEFLCQVAELSIALDWPAATIARGVKSQNFFARLRG